MLNSILLSVPNSDFGGMGLNYFVLVVLLLLPLTILEIVINWKIFTKANQAGWKSIIPFYNTYIYCKICQRPGWWLILLLIPFVNIVFSIILMLDLAKVFGKGNGFGVGLIFLKIIFLAILAFDDSKYIGKDPEMIEE